MKENWTSLAMILISLFLLYLGIKKQFEPLLLVGIAFGMLLTNLTAFTGAESHVPHRALDAVYGLKAPNFTTATVI